jgi:integrase/recombinase XerD
MLSRDVDRYIALRRTLGYKLVKTTRHLRAFAVFATDRGDTHLRACTALAWIEQAGRTPGARNRRWTDLVLFARFLHAEDARHELPPAGLFPVRTTRP